MEPLELTYKIEEADYVSANIWAALEKTPFWLAVNRYFLFAIDLIILIIAIVAGLPFGYYFFLIIVGFLPFLMRLSLMLRASKTYRKNKLLQEHFITFVFSEEGVTENFAGLSYNTEWKEIKQVVLYRHLFIMELNTSRVLFCPYQGLNESTQNELKTWVYAKLEKTKIHLGKKFKESENKNEAN